MNELFYTKELKDIINALRAEGRLNEQALANINRLAWKQRIFFLFMTVLFASLCFFVPDAVLGITNITMPLILTFLFGLLCILPITILNKFILPYASNCIVEAIIVGAHYDYIPFHGYRGWSIRYRFLLNNKHYTGSSVGIKIPDLGGIIPKENGVIEVAYCYKNPSVNAPVLKSKYNQFCLIK